MYQNKHALLIILDGWGYGEIPVANGIFLSNTPCFDHLIKNYPNSKLVTYGKEVGLPDGQMGNSEVGHLNIGGGRIVYQNLLKIDNAIKDDSFRKNKVLNEAIDYAKAKNKKIHLLGLLSDGGVHSHINHLKALGEIFEKNQANAYIHAFMDGRDTDQQGGLNYLKDLEADISNKKHVQIASLCGRYYAMDRDQRWERIKLAYDLMVKGEGEKSSNLSASLQQSYDDEITDEFIKPIVHIDQDGKAIATIEEDDVIICFNFRTDRCRQITRALHQEDFSEHGMKKMPLHYITMTQYDEKFKGVKVMFEDNDLVNTLGEVLSKNGKTQLRAAETEKYPHVTFFFSGGREAAFEGEERIVVNSPKVATYDLQPEMSADELTEKVLDHLEVKKPNFAVVNFANPDMVGHTGVKSAVIKAVETADACMERLVELAKVLNYSVFIIADHGNADYIINDNGSPNTAHSTNLVPFIFVDNNYKGEVKDGKLADIAPSILQLLDIVKPNEMDGDVLFK